MGACLASTPQSSLHFSLAAQRKESLLKSHGLVSCTFRWCRRAQARIRQAQGPTRQDARRRVPEGWHPGALEAAPRGATGVVMSVAWNPEAPLWP